MQTALTPEWRGKDDWYWLRCLCALVRVNMGMAMHLCMPVCAHNLVQTSARNYVRRRAYMCAYARMHMYGCMHMRLEKRDFNIRNAIFIIGKRKTIRNVIFTIETKKDYQKRDFV